MKKITKRKIIAPVLSVAPVVINLIISLLAAMSVIALSTLKPFEFLDDKEIVRFIMWLFGAAAAILCAYLAVKAVTKVRIKEVMRVKDFDFSVPIMLALFAFAVGRTAEQLLPLPMAERDGSGILPIIVTVLIAPIAEEIMFRFAGYELGRGAYTALDICIMNSLFYAICRVWSVPGLAASLVFGLCAALVYCKTRNILYTMLGNVLYSGLSFIPKGGWITLLIYGIIAAGCIIWYIKIFRKKYTENYFKVGIPETEEKLLNCQEAEGRSMKNSKKQKSFSKVCRNIHVFAFAAEILYSLAVLAVLLGAVGAPFIEFKVLISKWEMLPEIIWDTSLLIVFNFMRLIFGRLKKTDTPFSEGVDQKFKAIAYTLVIGGGVHFFTSLIVSGYVSMSVSAAELDRYFSFTDGLYMLMIGAVIWGLAYVFERGCVLQRESDETL